MVATLDLGTLHGCTVVNADFGLRANKDKCLKCHSF